MPWPDVPTAWKRLEKREIPQRREFSEISDDVWKFVKKCWSPRAPDVRPSAQEVFSFISGNLEDVSMLPQCGSCGQLIHASSQLHANLAHVGASSHNVLIFGETGVGKSSIINLIAGEPLADISSGATVCTMEATSYDVVLADGQGLDHHIRFFDTAGLNQPNFAQNHHLTAIEKASELIARLQRKGGIYLLIFCIRGGTITANMVQNYRLFSHILCQNQVPVAFVITGLENEPSMEEWWNLNAAIFERYSLSCVAHACVTATRGLNNYYATQYQQSQITIRSMLLEHLSSTTRTVVKVKDLKWYLPRRPKSLTVEELTRQLQYMCKFSRLEAEYLAAKIWARRMENLDLTL